MVDEFRRSQAIGSLLLVQPTASFDIVKPTPEGRVGQISPLSRTDIWINGGFFVFRNEIFDYIKPGEELVREPFQRLIENDAVLAHRSGCFWQCMDTFKDKQSLEELNQGSEPWKVWNRTTTQSSAIQVLMPAAHDLTAVDGPRRRTASNSVSGLPRR